MSARKIANFSISTLPRRKYFSSSFSKVITERMPLLTSVNSCHKQQQQQYIPSVSYSQALGSLTKDQAHDLVFRLNDEERGILYQTLQNFQIKQEKQSLESQLAASKWRSRFGRPTKVDPKLSEVVGGSYCKMPEDWLQKRIAAATPPPKSNELLRLALINSLPFVGFGFLDNFTMIIAGDYIEHSLGMIMTISTMAAAALGNTISDVLGIGSAVYVERFVELIGIRSPDLTPVQLEMKSSRRASNLGRVFGITAGCLLGMLPLLFMKEKEKNDGKEGGAVEHNNQSNEPTTTTAAK